MARTFHHGDRAKQSRFGNRYRTYQLLSYGLHVDAPPKRKRESHYWEWMSTPGWWIREFMNRPHRVRTNHMLRELRKLADLDDAPIFPHPKKPHIYYW